MARFWVKSPAGKPDDSFAVLQRIGSVEGGEHEPGESGRFALPNGLGGPRRKNADRDDQCVRASRFRSGVVISIAEAEARGRVQRDKRQCLG